MDQRADARQQLTRRAVNQFIGSVTGLTVALPHPDGNTIRLTISNTETGQPLGHVDVDMTNLADLARHADRRVQAGTAIPATSPLPAPAARTNRPTLRLVGGDR